MLKYLDFFTSRSTLRNYSSERQVSDEDLAVSYTHLTLPTIRLV